ncbi:MAG: peptidylprolyl isomerase [Bacteroidetes bacterium]|nr:peptidylprolyl isomerase [Bacteroidota bacterium]
MKLIPCLIISTLLAASCGNQASKKENAQIDPEPAGPLFDVADLPEEPLFDLETTHGTMRIKLYKETPGHRDNFAKLVADRYFDGILFHRVVKGFMIQAGETGEAPTKIQLEYGGTSGVNYTIPAEIVPGLTHKRGALAAARSNNPEKASSGSQFYIVHTDDGAKHLDGNYTIYGEVIDGFEVIDTIANEPTTGPNKDRTIDPPKIISIKPVF